MIALLRLRYIQFLKKGRPKAVQTKKKTRQSHQQVLTGYKITYELQIYVACIILFYNIDW